MLQRATGALFGTRGQRQPAPETHIANVAGNRQLHGKAYLIEFYASDGVTPDSVFVFSLPPESEELTYTQRKTETKTFGGLHVDEYGTDAVRIVLSGSTVNQSLKLIGGRDAGKWLTGEEEIYYFRDLVLKYRSTDNLQKPANGKIIVYDLSKVSVSRRRTGNVVMNFWRAFPGDFKISRSSDRPFTYKYSFEFTGVARREGGGFASRAEPPELDGGSPGLIRRTARDLQAAIRFVDGIAARINEVVRRADEVSSLLRLLGNVKSRSVNTLSGMIASVGGAAAGLLDGVGAAAGGLNSAASLPRTAVLKTLNVGVDIQNAANRLMRATASLVAECRDRFDPGGDCRDIPREVLDRFSVNGEEFRDSVSVMLDRAENAANGLAAAAKSADVPDVTAGLPDPATGEQRLVLSYGYTGVTLKSTDTLESLAAEHLGDPDAAMDIAAFNGAASLSVDLRPGDVIRIPITRLTGSVADNRVYARRGDRDNYGRDIRLTDDGRVTASASGDYALVGGPRNLAQAVLLRLRESVARRIRLNTYGIRAGVADPAAGAAYVTSSVELTVSGDPRVASVDGIRFRGEGDFLNVDVAYSDINGSGGNVAGRM